MNYYLKFLGAFLFSITLFLTSCQKEETNDLLSDHEIEELENTANTETSAKEPDQPFASYTTVNGQKFYSKSGNLSQGQWKGIAISKSYITSNGGKIAALLRSYSGDADLYFYANNSWRRIKSSTQGGTSTELLYLEDSELYGNESKLYIYIYGYKSSQYKLELYHVGSNNGNQNSSTAFPETVIKTYNSTSVFATTQNVFNDDQSDWNQSLDGQCTWYAYGRVQELVSSGHLTQAEGTRFYNAFVQTGGRSARYWPNKLGGVWTSTNQYVLPTNKRRKGLIAVWQYGTHGHVAFVEEVNSNKTQYRITDFNRSLNEQYKSSWMPFEGDDRIGGVYPTFYELELN